jgi:Domain of unknown function (DUF5753)
VGVDRTTIGVWERGESTPHPRQRTAYAASLGIALEELDRLLSGLPEPVGSTPVRLAQYLGSEQSASAIRSHEPQVVHGLLQTPEYAAAIARSVGISETPDSYVQRNVEQRAQRQKRINDGSLELHVIQSEIPLRLRMGNDATMATQLRHIMELVDNPNLNVTVQIVPFTVGQYEALRVGAISVMVHPWSPGPSVYVRRYGTGSEAVEDPDEAANFIAIYEHAASLALSPQDSLAFLAQVANEWER